MHACYSTCEKIRGQPAGIRSFHLLRGSRGSHSGVELWKHELSPAEPSVQFSYNGNSMPVNFCVLQIKRQKPGETEGLAQGTQSQSLSVLTPKAGHFPVCVPEVRVCVFLISFSFLTFISFR